MSPVLIQFDESMAFRKILNVTNKEELAAFELEPAAISSLFGSEWEKRTIVQIQELPKHLITGCACN